MRLFTENSRALHISMIPQSALIIVAIIDDISDHGAISSDAYCSTNRTNITTAAPVANNHIINIIIIINITIIIIITSTITISSIILIIIIHQSSDLLHTTSGM